VRQSTVIKAASNHVEQARVSLGQPPYVSHAELVGQPSRQTKQKGLENDPEEFDVPDFQMLPEPARPDQPSARGSIPIEPADFAVNIPTLPCPKPNQAQMEFDQDNNPYFLSEQ